MSAEPAEKPAPATGCPLLAVRVGAAEKKEMWEWLGDWEPARFDLAEARKAFDR